MHGSSAIILVQWPAIIDRPRFIERQLFLTTGNVQQHEPKLELLTGMERQPRPQS